VHKTQNIIGWPSTHDYINFVEDNMIPNCHTTKADIIRAKNIFGPNFGSIKVKATRRPTQHVQLKWQDRSRNKVENHGNVTLTIAIMAINKIPYVITTSMNIQFGTEELICNKNTGTIMTSIRQVVQAYKTLGFRVTIKLGVGVFECTRKYLEEIGIIINVASINEHVPEI